MYPPEALETEWVWGHVHWERILSCLRPPWLSCVKNAAYGSSGLKSLLGTWAKMTHWVQLSLHHGNMGVDQRSSFFYSHISPPCSSRRHSVSCVRACSECENSCAIYDSFPIKTKQVSAKNSCRAVQKNPSCQEKFLATHLTVIRQFRVMCWFVVAPEEIVS